MMGIGPIELGLLVLLFAMLFGPGTVLVWWLVTQARAGGPPAGEAGDPAFAAARERFARGEINREEFEEIKSALGH